VTGGGGLIVFLGDEVQIENYNQLLASDDGLPLLPAKLIRAMPISQDFFDPLDYRHAVLAAFQGFPKAGLLSTPVWKHVRLAPRAGSTVALGFLNGDPAVVEGHVGRGTCFLVATAASSDSLDRSVDPPRPWTALPLWPSFPPLMQEMVQLTVAGRAANRNIAVGDELRGSVPGVSSEAHLTLSGPGRFVERLPIHIQEGQARWSSPQLQTAGVYQAEFSGAVQHFAVNLDCTESNLTRLDAGLLPEQLHVQPAAPPDEATGRDGATSRSYFRWCLAAVLLLLVAEPCLAWQWGRVRQ
jgi:hypothetical protein